MAVFYRDRKIKRSLKKRIRPLTVFSLFFFLFLPLSAGAEIVTDEIGRKVELPEKIERIVALTPSLVEVLFALDLGDKVVGATQWSDYPLQAKKIPKVGSYVSPSLERIASLAPDLVLANREGNPPWLVEKLSASGIPVFVTDPRDPQNLPESLVLLGKICGASNKGEELALKLKTQFALVKKIIGPRPKVPTLMVVGNRPLITAGPKSYGARLLAMAGGKSIAPDNSGTWPRLSMEFVVEAKPKLVVISTMEKGQDLAREIAFWKTMPVLCDQKGYRVESLNSDIIDRPGPRLGKGLVALARLVHPKAFAKKEKP